MESFNFTHNALRKPFLPAYLRRWARTPLRSYGATNPSLLGRLRSKGNHAYPARCGLEYQTYLGSHISVGVRLMASTAATRASSSSFFSLMTRKTGSKLPTVDRLTPFLAHGLVTALQKREEFTEKPCKNILFSPFLCPPEALPKGRFVFPVMKRRFPKKPDRFTT